MDIYIDGLRVHIETQEIVGLLSFRNELLIGRHHSLVEIGMAHKTPIDKHELQGVALTGILGFAHIALDLDQRGIDVHWQELLVQAATHESRDTLAEGALHQLIHHIAVVSERELDIIVDQRQFLKLLDNIAQFHLIGLEELAPCRDIKENVLDHEIAANGAGVGFLTLALRRIDHQAGSQLLVMATGSQLDLRDSSNRCQSLATKAHRLQCKQVIGRTYFARAVTFKRQACVGLTHPHPIINDLNQGAPGILQNNLNVACLGVDGIFHQFLDDVSGSLNDLASGNLVGDRVGQEFNNVTHGYSLG